MLDGTANLCAPLRIFFQFSVEKEVECEAQRCFYTNDIITGIVW
jgi:hypothetical protein